MSPFAPFRPTKPFQVHHIDLTTTSPLDAAIIVQVELTVAWAALLRALRRPS